MSQIEAIYRHGVFEPLEPVNLKEEQRVRLSIEPADKEKFETWLERVKQHHAQLVFQCRNAAGHRGLGKEQLFSRARNAFERGDPVEGFNKTEVHGGWFMAMGLF